MRALLAAALLFACAPNHRDLQKDEDVRFESYARVAVPAFTDPRGRGVALAEALDKVLETRMQAPVDRKTLDALLETYKPDRENGLGTEALEMIRTKTSADAIVFASMAPDWSAILVAVVETEMGNKVISGVVRPPEGQKAFATPQDAAERLAAALSGR